jgi:ubiquinone biosynthesis protein
MKDILAGAMSQAATPSKPTPALGAKARTVSVHRSARNDGWRFLRAYSTTFVVIASYVWLSTRARFFGRSWRAARIGDVHTRNAKRVYVTIVRLQGLFIKVGQLLSIMANFLPPEFRGELEALQDQVPPRPYDEIAERLASEIGDAMILFAELDREPIASASLGQVHSARLVDGRRVCVKVQHKNIDRIVRLDLGPSVASWDRPVVRPGAGARRVLPPDQRAPVAGARLRARGRTTSSASRRTSLKDESVVFPKPIRELCTERVLTTTFVEGSRQATSRASTRWASTRRTWRDGSCVSFCQMIFVDGVYHADPSPRERARAEQWGDRPARLRRRGGAQPQHAGGIPEFLEGVLRRDTDRLVKAMRKMGFISRTTDEG